MESSSSVKDTSEVIMPNTDNSMSTDEIDSYNDPLFVSNIPNGAYKWNKQNFCKFCKKGVIKMSRHLKHVHKDEDDVRKMNALPRKSEEKRQIQEQLRREGNYKYNKESLRRNKGFIMPQTRPRNKKHIEAKSYLPCVYCKGFFGKKYLYKHHERCFMNISRRKTKKVALESQLLLENYSFGTSDSFKNNIVLEMTNDEITQTAIGDFLIMKFGESIYSKLKKQHNANYIRQRMRQTARLLIIAKSIDDELEDLEDLLQPKNYDTIIKSVKILGDYNESSGEYGISALPLKIGHNLRKFASVLQTLGIMTSNTNTIQKSRHFLDLMNSEYIVVASQALTSLNHKKFNKPKYLPVTEDVKKLTVYVQRQMSTYSEALKNKGDSDSYIKLAQATLVALLLFNRRRTGEIQRITRRFPQGNKCQNIH
uniref:Kinesin-related protein 4 isoform X2 n=1 Tax=Hirondellea gigas TaxID=1518452 RepID=A0A6A7FWU4_9CRUS